MTERIDSAESGADGAAGLTLERMRREVAEILYLEPEEVGDEDDLLDLGLDSVRLMSLTARWNEAGARVSFAELGEHPVLRRWWEAVERTLRPATSE